MILINWYLSDLIYEIKKVQRYDFNIITVNLEQISKFFSSDVDKVELSGFAWLHSDEIFAFLVVIFAHDLQKFECSPVGSYTKSTV